MKRTLARRGCCAAALFVATVLAGTGPVHAGEVSITPSNFELVVHPGEDHTEVVYIRYGKDGPADTQPLRMVLSTEDWDMNEAGQLRFEAEEELTGSARPWIVFSPGEAEVRPGETLVTRVSVIVPEDAAPGEYRAALLAQPRVPYRELKEGERRLDLHCRLASIVYVTVPPVTRGVDLEGLRVARAEDRWIVVPRLINTGQVTVRVHDSFEILSLDTGIECERTVQESGVVLPGKSRELVQWLPCRLPQGRYSLVYRADLGTDLPVLEGQTTFEIPANGSGPAIATAEP
ncbi:MAG: hypothetical protein DHS20C21_13340 [Gemmatimonadota bacterium]|nr:MAG: hypothetical protein DHS20C21_13340 [Gemmatimonadota bacterium]